MKNWYENGVRRLHPYLKKNLKKYFYQQKLLGNGENYIEKNP